MIIIDGKDVLHLKKYDVRTVKKIYDTGTKILTNGNDGMSDLEKGLYISAGHAFDLIAAIAPPPGQKMKKKLDLTIETQENIGNAVIILAIANRAKGMDERDIRASIAKAVSSYLLFQMWNFFMAFKGNLRPEFDVSFGMNFATGELTMKTQRICLKDNGESGNTYVFDALKVGREYAENDVHFFDENEAIGTDMHSLYERVGEQLNSFLEN